MFKFKNKFDSYSLSYSTEEFVKTLEEDMEKFPFLLTEGRKTWFKEKPKIVDEIDKQLRKNFSIKDVNKLVFSLYLPPTDHEGKIANKETLVSDQKEHVLTRIIISTIDEQLQVGVMGKESDKIEFKQWIAYQTPPLIGGILKYKFENSKFINMPPRKGFRSVKKSKAINKRYILLFDYIVGEEDMKELALALENINSSMGKKSSKIEKDIEKALAAFKKK